MTWKKLWKTIAVIANPFKIVASFLSKSWSEFNVSAPEVRTSSMERFDFENSLPCFADLASSNDLTAATYLSAQVQTGINICAPLWPNSNEIKRPNSKEGGRRDSNMA